MWWNQYRSYQHQSTESYCLVNPSWLRLLPSFVHYNLHKDAFQASRDGRETFENGCWKQSHHHVICCCKSAHLHPWKTWERVFYFFFWICQRNLLDLGIWNSTNQMSTWFEIAYTQLVKVWMNEYHGFISCSTEHLPSLSEIPCLR